MSSAPGNASGKITKDIATGTAGGGRVGDDARAMARVSCNITAQVFPCTSGECVPFALRCNGVPDCADGSDEAVIECGKFSLLLPLSPLSSLLSLISFCFPPFPRVDFLLSFCLFRFLISFLPFIHHFILFSCLLSLFISSPFSVFSFLSAQL